MGADAGPEASAEDNDGLVSVGRSPLIGSCNPAHPFPPPLPNPNGRCYRVYQTLVGTRYLDAYTSGTPYAVTRPRQTDGTQFWCFSWVDDRGDNAVYRIRHMTTSGLFLDAYESGNDNGAVLRDGQTDGSQDWVLIPDCGLARFKQVSSGRYLDAYNSDANDWRAVTRSKQDDDSQLWWMTTTP
jgi:hypothetical protein